MAKIFKTSRKTLTSFPEKIKATGLVLKNNQNIREAGYSKKIIFSFLPLFLACQPNHDNPQHSHNLKTAYIF